MKKVSKIFVLAIVLMVLCCIGAASAADNSTTYEVALSDEVVDVEMVEEQEPIASSEEVIDDILENDGGTINSDEDCIIYVGKNTTENGQGTSEDPFATLKLACDNANTKHHRNVTVNIQKGTYYLGGQLNFDTDNLIIQGDGNVTIKNLYNYDISSWDMSGDALYGEAFGLTSSSSNITLSNIIFDANDRSVDFYEMDLAEMTGGFMNGVFKSYFFPFYGETNLATFNNCSFIGFKGKNYLTGIEYNSHFINCLFDIHNTWSTIFYGSVASNTEHNFEYCVFNLPIESISLTTGNLKFPCGILMDSVWFGQNSLPGYMGPFVEGIVENPDGTWNTTYTIPVNRYAIFSVSQNYLGNNKYEILGKLTWNGTEDQEGMENFQPMTVKLSSTTGDINETAVLTNGNFRAVYTSTNLNNKVTATLDEEEIELNFNTTDIILEPVSIYYGDDQNITVTFPQVINSTVIISINNKTYDVKVNESDSFTYTIKDMILKADTYIVNVTLNDDKTQLYGANSTTFTVSKVSSYAFSPDIPSEAKVGETKTVTLELPIDATGTVTVYLNNKPFTKEASTVTEITISGFVVGDNTVAVFYSGDDKYANKTKEPSVVTAEKVPVNITNNTIVIDSPANSNTPNVSINLTSDATGNLTVTVNGKNYTQELTNGSATVTITDLATGTYNAVVTYSGDDKYDSITQNVTVTVNAIKTNIVAPSVTTTYNVAKKLIVTLKDANSNPLIGKKVTVNVGSISKTLNTDANGQVSVDISSLVPNTYTATIKFEADGKYAQSTATTKVVVNKAKSMITAKKATFKAKKKTKKYTITLKAGKKAISKVKVTLKVKGKTYKATTNAKGKATFKITKLTKKGKHNAVIKFNGNKYYKAISKKVKLTIKK